MGCDSFLPAQDFSFIIMSFDEQKILILMEHNLSFFSLRLVLSLTAQ